MTFQRTILVVACVLLAQMATAEQTAPQLSPAATAAEAGLVDVRSAVPDIALEMRYAGSDNFVGQPIRGYEAPKCLLLAPVAQALANVQRDLRTQGYALKVFDCYRPARAVAHFVEWAGDLSDQRNKARYYPLLAKDKLLGDYIAPVSGHSRGATLDLTLLRCRRGNCKELDMGTGFDYFGPLANTDSPEIGRRQHRNRLRLLAAMKRHGFSNYPMEWWHYTWVPEPSPDRMFDVPVK